ncbi:hypothetical protein T10_10265 [Trichinella papuae]|uniref:Uncharacterized protein n=1 Tax=Trichinella papuae TaxID=268474 RepID=A0A0V1N878_9BILA|nr:hypothetical protein T10_10265 [Trichinella papuae]
MLCTYISKTLYKKHYNDLEVMQIYDPALCKKILKRKIHIVEIYYISQLCDGYLFKFSKLYKSL